MSTRPIYCREDTCIQQGVRSIPVCFFVHTALRIRTKKFVYGLLPSSKRSSLRFWKSVMAVLQRRRSAKDRYSSLELETPSRPDLEVKFLGSRRVSSLDCRSGDGDATTVVNWERVTMSIGLCLFTWRHSITRILFKWLAVLPSILLPWQVTASHEF